jgi:hypothetical protein
MDGTKSGAIPVPRETIYYWSAFNKYPRLVIKIASRLYWDEDEWNRMATESIEAKEWYKNRP